LLVNAADPDALSARTQTGHRVLCGPLDLIDPDEHESHEMFHTHNMFVSNSQEYVVAAPEAGPSVRPPTPH
jgi:hypothetical protein